MSLLVDAFNWIVEQTDPIVKLRDDKTIIRKPDGSTEVLQEAYVAQNQKTIEFKSLSGFMDFISREEYKDSEYFIHIIDESTIALRSDLDDRKIRITPAKATPFESLSQSFQPGNYYSQEDFTVVLKAGFEVTDDLSGLLKITGNITDRMFNQSVDDGVSQEVSVKTGIATVEGVEVPNYVSLAPYRTFTEIEQPASTYFLRLKKDKYGDGEVKIALFLADHGKWKLQALERIRQFLENEMKERDKFPQFPIIS